MISYSSHNDYFDTIYMYMYIHNGVIGLQNPYINELLIIISEYI